ncbi:MAG: ATP-binding protein, partial [Planctomycetota bacterium]
ELAASTAELWKNGLAGWGQGPDRVRRYNDACERLIFTPGAGHGIPITVLKSFDAPPAELREDRDAFGQRVSSAVSGLLALLGIDADPVRSREHIFLSNVLTGAWQAGKDLDIAEMIREIQQPPFQRVGVMDLESFFPAKDRQALAMDLNNLLASPSFAGWMQGQPLDVKQLLHNEEGKPRLSIISIAHLDDAQRMFFVTILLNEVLAWMRTQPGTGSLRALVYMDEVYGYFPPVSNPPSKQPMLTLLKQARAFGVGCVLATQNPVDLDYKGLSNCGTWLLGRLQTERDKARVIEGLEGASAQAGSTFDKRAMEATLAALGSRVFLMNNVHEDAPRVFHTRWAMSYLSGPLARGQIQRLMDPVRDRFAPPGAGEADPSNPGAPAAVAAAGSRLPIVPSDIPQRFVACVEPPPRGSKLEYRPGLVGSAKLHYVKASAGVDVWRDAWASKCFNERVPDGLWAESVVADRAPHLLEGPEYQDDDVRFAHPPADLLTAKHYKGYGRELRDHLYQSQRLVLHTCEELDEASRPGEGEADFRQRIAHRAAELGAKELAEIQAGFAAKLKKAEEKIAKKQAYYDEQKSQFWGRLGGLVWLVVELALSAFGGKKTRRRSSSTVTAARSAATERGQANRAKLALDEALADRDALLQEQADAVEEAKRAYTADTLPLETVEIGPRKSDIDVGQVVLAWLPHQVSAAGAATPLY